MQTQAASYGVAITSAHPEPDTHFFLQGWDHQTLVTVSSPSDPSSRHLFTREWATAEPSHALVRNASVPPPNPLPVTSVPLPARRVDEVPSPTPNSFSGPPLQFDETPIRIPSFLIYNVLQRYASRSIILREYQRCFVEWCVVQEKLRSDPTAEMRFKIKFPSFFPSTRIGAARPMTVYNRTLLAPEYFKLAQMLGSEILLTSFYSISDTDYTIAISGVSAIMHRCGIDFVNRYIFYMVFLSCRIRIARPMSFTKCLFVGCEFINRDDMSLEMIDCIVFH